MIVYVLGLSPLLDDCLSFTCDDCYASGRAGCWRRAVYLDMTDPNTNCPPGWNETDYPKRTCGRVSDGGSTCDSVYFPASGGEYSQVCGKIRAYQWGWTIGFYSNHIESYFSGVAMMHGSPQQHIWTFAAGLVENNTTHPYAQRPFDTSTNMPIPSLILLVVITSVS